MKKKNSGSPKAKFNPLSPLPLISFLSLLFSLVPTVARRSHRLQLSNRFFSPTRDFGNPEGGLDYQ